MSLRAAQSGQLPHPAAVSCSRLERGGCAATGRDLLILRMSFLEHSPAVGRDGTGKVILRFLKVKQQCVKPILQKGLAVVVVLHAVLSTLTRNMLCGRLIRAGGLEELHPSL